MLIRWDDLKPGDVVKYTDELKNFYNSRDFYSEYAKKKANDNFLIREVKDLGNRILISFESIEHAWRSGVSITYNGQSCGLFDVFKGRVFDIVFLNED